MIKKIGVLFVFYLFYKIYKSKNRILFFIFKLTSKGNKYIKKKQLKALTTIKEKVFHTKWNHHYNTLTNEGTSIESIKKIVFERKGKLNTKISGTIYNNSDMNRQIANYMYNLYMYSNPLHTDLFPELNKMESEIVKMVGHLFDLPKDGGGNLTLEELKVLY